MSFAVESAQAAQRAAAACSSQRFVCQFAAGAFAWSYRNAEGRLLLAGPPAADLWQAHRLLLAAIQQAAASGSLFSPVDEEEDPAAALNEPADDEVERGGSEGARQARSRSA